MTAQSLAITLHSITKGDPNYKLTTLRQPVKIKGAINCTEEVVLAKATGEVRLTFPILGEQFVLHSIRRACY